MKSVLTAAVLLVLPIELLAAGSFRPEVELAPILAEAPEVRDFVASSLELAPSGSAARIGNAVNPRFGGRRVGPYRILAKPRGSAGPFTFELLFHTELVLLGEDGEAVALPEADVIRERFESLELRPIEAE